MNNSQELFDFFREDIVDQATPYLWTEEEVTDYADIAYRQFIRYTGGIADFTSDACSIELSVGVDLYDTHPTIIRIMEASLRSTGREIKVLNNTDVPRLFGTFSDYGLTRDLITKNTPGQPRFMIIGMQKDLAKVIQIPVEVDFIDMVIYRLPFEHIVDGSHPLSDIDTEHHRSLLNGMKAMAYAKQDAETFDKTKSVDAEAKFRAYCAERKAEWERKLYKPRAVAYGGL
jgi:hypothetical protein